MSTLQPIDLGTLACVLPLVNSEQKIERVVVTSARKIAVLYTGYATDSLPEAFEHSLETNELIVKYSATPLRVAIFSKHTTPFDCRIQVTAHQPKISQPQRFTQTALKACTVVQMRRVELKARVAPPTTGFCFTTANS